VADVVPPRWGKPTVLSLIHLRSHFTAITAKERQGKAKEMRGKGKE